DISAEAIELARQNAERHGLKERVHFFQGDGFAAVPAGLEFDLILSNPPYIPTPEISTLQPEVRDYDPRPALDGGPDGLEFFRRLAAEAGAHLKPGGRIMLEFGDGQADALRALFGPEKWIVEAVAEDYTGRPRVF